MDEFFSTSPSSLTSIPAVNTASSTTVEKTFTTNRETIPWKPSASVSALKLRAKMLRQVREFFESRGFFEVQTPVLSRDTTVDRNLQPPMVENLLPGSPPFYLQTSPEFPMKRLLAAGSGSIYQICPAFRAEEKGARHNPEFTIIEWYQIDETQDQGFENGMQLLSDLCTLLLDRPAARRISYRQAFLNASCPDPFLSPNAEIRRYCETSNVCVPENFDPDDRDGWLDLILTERVQPWLGTLSSPSIVYHYPAAQAALSQIAETDYGRVAERFELFDTGVWGENLELANGYHELADADELKHRQDEANSQRIKDGHQPLPADSILLAAMRAGFPNCTGCAMGFDRMVMLKAGLSQISQVMAFDYDRA